MLEAEDKWQQLEVLVVEEVDLMVVDPIAHCRWECERNRCVTLPRQ